MLQLSFILFIITVVLIISEALLLIFKKLGDTEKYMIHSATLTSAVLTVLCAIIVIFM